MNAIDVGCGLDTTKRKSTDPLHRPINAYQFGDLLSNLGFTQVATSDYQAGDVIVFDQGEGVLFVSHMQMFNGTKWVSDFMQGKDIYPGQGEWKNLNRTVYRHNSVPTAPSCNNSSNNSKPDNNPKPTGPGWTMDRSEIGYDQQADGNAKIGRHRHILVCRRFCARTIGVSI
jgi:hypothetical protein